jgi:hypothetical protein
MPVFELAVEVINAVRLETVAFVKSPTNRPDAPVIDKFAVTVSFATLLVVIFAVVALAVVNTALPPVIDTFDRLFVPLPMPLMALTTVVKSLSSCDNGIEVVAVANV